MPTHRSDPELVKACLAGHDSAWTTLVDRYGRLVYSVPRRYGLAEADAEDVVQAVFVNLFRHLDRLRDHTRLSAWLITAAHRESWRVGRSREVAGLDEVITDVGAPEEEQLERWDREDQVRRALGTLGGRCEELLRALYGSGAEGGYESVAAALGMPVGSLGPTRARCLEKLRRLLVEMGFEADEGIPTSG